MKKGCILWFLFCFLIGVMPLRAQTLTKGDCSYSPVSVSSEPLIVSDTWASVSGRFENQSGSILPKPPFLCSPQYAVRVTLYWTTDITKFNEITAESWGSGGNTFKFNAGGKNYKTLYACSMPTFDFIIGDGGYNGTVATDQLTSGTTYYYRFYYYRWVGSQLTDLCPSPIYSFKTASSPYSLPSNLSPSAQTVCGGQTPQQIVGAVTAMPLMGFEWQYVINGKATFVGGASEANYMPPSSPPDGSTPGNNGTTFTFQRTARNGNNAVVNTADVTYMSATCSANPILSLSGSNNITVKTNPAAASGTTYSWESKPAGGSWVADNSSTNTSLTIPTPNSNTSSYRAKLNYGGCCNSYSNEYDAGIKAFTTNIGNQTWMSQNLNPSIDNISGGGALTAARWTTITTTNTLPGYCWYGNDSVSNPDFGALYNSVAVTQNVCPTGWHVPNLTEWNTLITSVGGTNVAGDALKQTGTTNWTTASTLNDAFDFSALGSGFMALSGLDLSYTAKKTDARIWTYSTDNSGNVTFYEISITNNSKAITIYKIPDADKKKKGAAIRCVKNSP